MKFYLILFAVTIVRLHQAQCQSEIFVLRDPGGLKYSVEREHLRLGYSPKLIELGYVIGHVEKVQTRSAISGYSALTDYFSAQENLIENRKNIYHAGHEAATAHLSEPFNLTQAQNVRALSTSGKVPADRNLQLQPFEVCRRQALPLLKILLKMEVDRQSSESLAELLESQLREERGSGGLVCGKYLGPLNEVRIRDLLLNVKLLSALSSKPEEDRVYLLRTAAAAFHPRAPEDSRALFSFYLSRLIFLAHFSDKSLPPYTEMAQLIESNPQIFYQQKSFEDDTYNISVVNQISDLQELTIKGERFARGLLNAF